MAMQWMTLRPGVPLEFALAFDEGKMGKRGWVFGADRGRALFVRSAAAGAEIQRKLSAAGARRGDRVRLMLNVSYRGGERRETFEAWKISTSRWGAQPDGTFVVPVVGAVA